MLWPPKRLPNLLGRLTGVLHTLGEWVRCMLLLIDDYLLPLWYVNVADHQHIFPLIALHTSEVGISCDDPSKPFCVCSQARSPGPGLNAWRGRRRNGVDRRVRPTTVTGTNLMCHFWMPLLPLAPTAPPAPLNLQVLTSP